MTWKYLVGSPRIVFVVYWAFSALKTQRTERAESSELSGMGLIDLFIFTSASAVPTIRRDFLRGP